MSFWDASAVVSLCLTHEQSEALRALNATGGTMTVWWGTRTESVSAFSRLLRDRRLDHAGISDARQALSTLAGSWIEVHPTELLRSTAERLVMVHPLRAADAFQLSAALQACGGLPQGTDFVTLDRRLGEAARKEGFSVLP